MNKSVLYITRRFGFYLIAAFAALTLNFIIPRLMPGDPASIIFARFKGKLKPEAIDAMRESFGLTNDPILIQYFSYLKSFLMLLKYLQFCNYFLEQYLIFHFEQKKLIH